jgi:hypothetical protein
MGQGAGSSALQRSEMAAERQCCDCRPAAWHAGRVRSKAVCHWLLCNCLRSVGKLHDPNSLEREFPVGDPRKIDLARKY